MKLRSLPLLALLAATMITSCGKKSGPTTVESITIQKDDGSGKAGETVESLKSTDLKFHAQAKFDVGDSANAKADLIAVDTPAGKDVLVLTNEYKLEGISNTLTLDYSMEQPWPVGKYKIDVYANGKLAKTKEFNIE